MASYQIPQFLDSGDKILGPLNMRQFGYALGGFMVSAIIFTLAQSLVPGAQFYAIIPCIPIVGLAAYLALGRYNGRDSEIYVLKYIIFNSKPKWMVYARVPDVQDLNEKLNDYTTDKITKRWTDELGKQKAIKGNEFLTFNNQDSLKKASQIRALGNTIDLSTTNTMAEVYAGEAQIQAKEALLKQLLDAQAALKKK
jgi:hypothetical protein